MISTHLQSSAPKAFLATLLPELLLSILGHLYRLFDLLVVCKSIYPIAYQHLWSTYTLDIRSYRSNWGRLKTSVFINRGKLFRSGVEVCQKFTLWELNELQNGESVKILAELFRSGKMKPRYVNINLIQTRWFTKQDRNTSLIIGQEFWLPLATYCRSKPPGEIELSILDSNESFFTMLPMLDIQHLVTFVFNADFPSAFQGQWRMAPDDRYQQPKRPS